LGFGGQQTEPIQMNESISGYFTEDHRHCDRLLAACEAEISANAWQAADEAAIALRDRLLHHFVLKEGILFPELEQANPAAGGPTGVMRMEHQQIRQLLEDLAEAVSARDTDTCLGDLETLHMPGEQHNAKEEGILYPLADRSLQDSAETLIDRLRAV
jgi:iron-sulfur cluster repair protein YtfE (RIC family)